MELVRKTMQDAHLQLKAETGGQIAQLESRLGQLEQQIKKQEQFRSTSLNVLKQMLDESMSVVHSTPIDGTHPGQPLQPSTIDNLPQPEHEPVTISDVQRFLTQRQ